MVISSDKANRMWVEENGKKVDLAVMFSRRYGKSLLGGRQGIRVLVKQLTGQDMDLRKRINHVGDYTVTRTDVDGVVYYAIEKEVI